MLINPKKLLKRERQLKAVIGMGGKEFKILHEQFDKIYRESLPPQGGSFDYACKAD
jgi:hypothetical protein